MGIGRAMQVTLRPVAVGSQPCLSVPEDRPVIVTMGYLAPGIEMVMHAMVLLRSELPDLHYVVAGRTHPDVTRRDGERYRWCLEALADDLGLAGRVQLLDERLGPELQASLLGRADAVVVPYRSPDHSLGRTVTSAVRAHRPLVVTRGCLPAGVTAGGTAIAIEPDDDEACAAAIHHVLHRAGRPAVRSVFGPPVLS